MQHFEQHKRELDMEYRKQLRDALRVLELPVIERAELSRALQPLLYQGTDGRRTAHHVFHYVGMPGKFRGGDYALLSRADPEPCGLRVRQGTPVVIDKIGGDRLILHGSRSDLDAPFVKGLAYVLDERPPSWFPNYQRLSLALALAEFSDEPGRRLRRLLEGELAVEDVDRPQPPPDDLAGERARQAFDLAVRRNLTAIQGPPGTGKTHLLARVAREFVRRGLRVVLCCFTHRAINNALAAMIEAGVDADCLGKVGGSDESDLPTGVRLLDKQEYWKHPLPGMVAAMTVHAAFEPFGRPMSMSSRRARHRRPERDGKQDDAFWEALDRHNREVVSITRLPAGDSLADVVLFDEASQLTIPMALCGLAVASRAVLFGDHAQLPPVSAVASGEHASIFHFVAERYPQAFVRLNESFRMNEDLCAFPAERFYADDLAPAASARGRFLEVGVTEKAYEAVLEPRPASVFVRVDHSGFGQESPLEAVLIADLALVLLAAGLDTRTGLAVLAPHRRQNNAIRRALESLAPRRGLGAAQARRLSETLVIDTVDRMQGQERDVILYSLTASDDGVLDGEREFLFMPNRFNVAITRARRKLVIVGSRGFFHHVPHALAHAGWQGEQGVQARQMLADANVFKRWYLQHRDRAVDLTEHAATLLASLEWKP